MVAFHRNWMALTLLGLLTSAPAARANEPWPIERGASHETQPFRYDAKLWQGVPKNFIEDSPACVLYAGNWFLVDADGVVENITHEITRLNSRKAIEKLGEFRHITFDPSYQKLTLHTACLHKPDGRRLEVEPRHVQLRDSTTDYLVYDREKQLIISFPNLEVGDTLEVKWTIRGRNPEHGGGFFTRYAFGDTTYPVVRDEVVVQVPKSAAFHHASVEGRVEPVLSTSGDNQIYTWKCANIAQLPQEENTPSKEELRPAIVCSTFASWEAVGQWKQKLRADAWTASAEVKRVVAETTKGLTDPAAKARALTYWLRSNIRYVSSGEKHDYTPHSPARVLANRYGDCKDTSQLLAVMLREAGVPVALATLGALDDGQVVEAVPSPWGTHAILYVPLESGPRWIDTTLTLAAWDYLPREDLDRLCYIVDANGKTILRRTPKPNADNSRFEQTTFVRIGSDGTSRCERSTFAFGGAAMAQRDLYLDVPIGERRRLAAAELQDANTKARLLTLTLDEPVLRDLEQPVRTRLSYELPGHFVGNAEREGSLADSRVWSRLLAYNLDYDRLLPLELAAPFESRHRYVVQVPAGYALDSLPRDRRIASRWGRFEVQVKTPRGEEGSRLVEVIFTTRLEQIRVNPDQFAEYRTFHEAVTKAYRVWLTLKPFSNPADIPILEGVVALAPQDVGSTLTLAGLYQSEGRGADARRLLKRGLFYNPDDDSLWEKAVNSAANVQEKESLQRKLANRFPEEPRYTYALANLLIERGKYTEAITLLTPLAAEGEAGDRSDAEFARARCLYYTNKFAEALQSLQAARDLDPEGAVNPKWLLLGGQISEKLGQREPAGESYRAALLLDHDSADALAGLIRLALTADNRELAADYLRRFVGIDKLDLAQKAQAADFYLELGRFDDAYELAMPLISTGQSKLAHRIAGLVHLQRKNYADAIRHLERAEQDRAVLQGLVRAKICTSELSGMKALVERLAKLAPSSNELTIAQRVLARRAQLLEPKSTGSESALGALACAEELHYKGQRTELVTSLLDRALASEGDKVPGPAYALRALLALESGKLRQASDDADRAIALSPRDAQGYYVRGRIRLERGEPTALADLQTAADLSGRRDANVLHALADALDKSGETHRAIAAQREALRLSPNNRELSEQLKSMELRSKQLRSSTTP